MTKIALTLVAIFLLAGCMANKKPGDGREWIEVSCSGFADWQKCNEKASKYCPDGFEVGYRDESVIAQRRVMTFACKR